jgi:Cu+-exporting ATPase
MMVGDGPNDVLAFQQADSAVLTVEQNDGEFPDKLKEYADFVIEDISQVLQIDF